MSIKVGIPNLEDVSLYQLMLDIVTRALDCTRYPLFVDENNGRIGIRTVAPSASAALEIAGTTGALLIPRMTTTQKNALTAVNGMIVYDSTLNKFQGYENGAWTSFI